jgi:hypothetical protein
VRTFSTSPFVEVSFARDENVIYHEELLFAELARLGLAPFTPLGS